MNRSTAVTTWREVCGSDTVMASMPPTGRMLEEFTARIEAAERERCATVCEREMPVRCMEDAYANSILSARAAEIRGPNV